MHCNNELQSFDGLIGKDMYFRHSNLGNVKSLWCHYIQQALAIELWQCNYIQQSLRCKSIQSYAITSLYLTVLVHKTKTMPDNKTNCCRDVWGMCGSVYDVCMGVCMCVSFVEFFSVCIVVVVVVCLFVCLFVCFPYCLFVCLKFLGFMQNQYKSWAMLLYLIPLGPFGTIACFCFTNFISLWSAFCGPQQFCNVA